MMGWFKKKKKPVILDDFGFTESQRFEKRMKFIKNIADKHMASAHCGKTFPVKKHVVVPYEDLLKIWDIADKAYWETPVDG